MYYQLHLIYEAIELGMHSVKNKPMTKKEREEKRKKPRSDLPSLEIEDLHALNSIRFLR